MFSVGRVRSMSPGRAFAPAASACATPAANSPEFIDFVMSEGKGGLSGDRMAALRDDIVASVWRSHDRLADGHTAQVLRETLLCALEKSPSMQAAVNFGLSRDREPLGNIVYRNIHMVNPESDRSLQDAEDIADLILDDVRIDIDEPPILPLWEAGEDSDGQPFVSFGMALNPGSRHDSLWRQGVLQSVLFHLTGAIAQSDGAQPDPCGILARRVVQEVGWDGSPDPNCSETGGVQARRDRDYCCVSEAAERNLSAEKAFFQRLATISRFVLADPDFCDLKSRPDNAGQQSSMALLQSMASGRIPQAGTAAYAEHVLETGPSWPLSAAQVSACAADLAAATQRSAGRLADDHTRVAIQQTLSCALEQSAAMRAAVSFSRIYNLAALGEIGYCNGYVVIPDARSFFTELADIAELTLYDLSEFDTEDAPIQSVCEVGDDEAGRPMVSIGVAPDEDSGHYCLWQYGLLASVLYHLTNAQLTSSTTSGFPDSVHVLAHAVARELGWRVPQFQQLDLPERTQTLAERDLSALCDAAARHSEDEAAFFSRLSRLSLGEYVDAGLCPADESEPQLESESESDFDTVSTRSGMTLALGDSDAGSPAYPPLTWQPSPLPELPEAAAPQRPGSAHLVAGETMGGGLLAPPLWRGRSLSATDSESDFEELLPRPAGSSRLDSLAYAERILGVERARTLTAEQIERCSVSVRTMVQRSRVSLGDASTASAIQTVLLDAMLHSPTMQAALSFGLDNGRNPFAEITFQTQYVSNSGAASPMYEADAIRYMTAENLVRHDFDDLPIVPVNAAWVRVDGAPYVSVGLAPDRGNFSALLWNLGVLHLLLSHVIGVPADGHEEEFALNGPADLLAMRIGEELGWDVAQIRSMSLEDRIEVLADRDALGLIQRAQRNAGRERIFFSQLSAISRGRSIDPLFEEDSESDQDEREE